MTEDIACINIKNGDDYWKLPGGKLEQRETPEEALRRELREELKSF